MHCEEGKSAAPRLFRRCQTSVKESGLVCAVIVRFVRLSFERLILRGLELWKSIEKIAKRASSVAYAQAGDGVKFGHRLVEIGEEE
jgi:hypothetical protein